MSVDVTAIIKDLGPRLEEHRMAIREALSAGPPPPGLTPVDDATFMAFIDGMRQKFPPEEIITPDGRRIFESPWIVMCGLEGYKTTTPVEVYGGKQIIDRMLRIQRHGGARIRGG